MNRATITLRSPGATNHHVARVNQRRSTMKNYYDCISQYAVDRFLEPLRSVRWCLLMSVTDGQQYGTEKHAVYVCALSLWTTSVDFNKTEKALKQQKKH